jgi:hypothetical protein
MELQAELPGVHADRTVLKRTVSQRFVKNRLANMLFGQFMGIAPDGLLGDVLQQVA